MKRIFFTCASLLMLLASNVYAEPAVVVSDQFCTMFDANGNFIQATSSHFVLSESDNDNFTVKCSIKGLENETGGPVKFDFDSKPILCVHPEGAELTDDWFENISTAGNATLTCQFKY
jgi:hypothetical protein